MKFKSLSTMMVAGSVLSALVSPVAFSAAASFDSQQTQAIQGIVRDYLLSNPELLVEVSQNLQKKQQESMAQQAKEAIKTKSSELFTDKMTVLGNPKGNVTLVEFFDYQCIHCKKMSPIVDELLKKDANLRVIYKEFPIFGKSSETASKAALAAAMQGKYRAMHDALITQEKPLNDEGINKIAQSIGLNMKQFSTDMNSKTVKDALDANRKLAEELRLMGTPAFIVAETPAGQFKAGSQPTFIPGAISSASLQELINKAAH